MSTKKKVFTINAEQGEDLRKFFEELYISHNVRALELDEARMDDSGDCKYDIMRMFEERQKANRASNFAKLFGGIDYDRASDVIYKRYYGDE